MGMGHLFYCDHWSVYCMSRYCSFSQIAPLFHLPTWFLIIGLPVFWLELYAFKGGQGVSSPLAWILFAAVFFLSSKSEFFELISDIRNYYRSSAYFTRLYLIIGLVLAGLILSIVAYASFLPHPNSITSLFLTPRSSIKYLTML